MGPSFDLDMPFTCTDLDPFDLNTSSQHIPVDFAHVRRRISRGDYIRRPYGQPLDSVGKSEVNCNKHQLRAR